MRFVDAMLCFPTIFLLLALAALIEPSVTSIVVLIAVTSWMEVARVVEGQIRSLRERDFALAADRSAPATAASCSASSCPTPSRPSWSPPR